MKKINAYLMTGMMALAVLSSCKNEDTSGFNENEKENLKTAIASFKISLGGAGSRAGEGIPGTAEEQKVNDITLLIFSTKEELEGTKADVLESAERMTIAEGVTNYKMNVMTTEGQKVIFAIANNPQGNGSGTTYENEIKYSVGQTYDAFISQNSAAVTGDNDQVKLLTISNDNGFQMISEPQMITVEGYATEAETEAAAEPGGKNNFPITISRLSSKVQVMFADAVKSDDEFNPADVEVSVATDPAPIFTVAQLQKSIYLEPKMGGYDNSNPTPNLTTHTGESAFVAEINWFKTETTTTGWSGTVDKSAYVSENIIPVATPLRKYATAVILKTKLNITKFNKSASNSNYNQDADGSFYAVCKFKNEDSSGNLTDEEKVYSNLDPANPYAGIFPNVEQANAYLMNELSGDQVNYAVVKFPGGYAYYRVNLTNYNVENLADVYSVPRNSYYHVNVKSLKNVGWDNPADLVNPDDENEVKPNKVSISADINVQPWIPINMDESLQ